jgi:hypothetical protein
MADIATAVATAIDTATTMANINVSEPQEKKKRIKKDKKTDKKPKLRSQPKTIEEFFIARAREPSYFTINDRGELIAPPIKSDDVERRFTIPSYRTLTTQERIELETIRKETISVAEEAVQEAQRELREKLLAYRNGDVYASDVVLANIEVAQKEKELQAKAWSLRQVNDIESIATNELFHDMPYEERKVSHPVFKFRHYPYDLQTLYVSEGAAPEEQQEQQPQGEPESQPQQQQPMTAADRGRLGGILKIRRKKFQ